MKESCAFIVIDSGFSREVLEQGGRVIAAYDVPRKLKYESTEFLSDSQLDDFTGDPMGHGSIVLSRLLSVVPADAKLILVRGFGVSDVCRTVWKGGEIMQAGWCEAYVWAVEYAKARGMVSVGNCSFGGVTHAMDGTGWEAFQVAKCSGPGKPGHILVAAAGTGDGRAVHGSLTLLAGEDKSFIADQDTDCEYNCWFGLGQEPPTDCRWHLDAWQNGQLMFSANSQDVPVNMWNQRQQLKFRLWGAARVVIDIKREHAYDENFGLAVDVYAEGARFRNWVSPHLIPEPACFPTVIAVGLQASTYSPTQKEPGKKPEVLLPGSGQISFRIPEITGAVGQLLEKYPGLDIEGVKAMLGKYPQ
jgi:hypothetical protein